MPLTIFRNRTFTLANCTCMLSYLTQQLSTTYLYPFFLADVMMMSAYHSGLVMLTAPVTMMIFSPVGGDLSDKKGRKAASRIRIVSHYFQLFRNRLFPSGAKSVLRDCSTGLYGRGKWAQCVGHQQLYIGVSGHQHVGSSIRNLGYHEKYWKYPWYSDWKCDADHERSTLSFRGIV